MTAPCGEDSWTRSLPLLLLLAVRRKDMPKHADDNQGARPEEDRQRERWKDRPGPSFTEEKTKTKPRLLVPASLSSSVLLKRNFFRSHFLPRSAPWKKKDLRGENLISSARDRRRERGKKEDHSNRMKIYTARQCPRHGKKSLSQGRGKKERRREGSCPGLFLSP